jgi:hypothetical protein
MMKRLNKLQMETGIIKGYLKRPQRDTFKIKKIEIMP